MGDLVLGDSVLSLTSEIIQKYQIQGLVLDVDETLVPIHHSQTSPELVVWVEKIKSLTSLWLVSNNISQDRVGRIGNSLNIPYITGARKPSRRKLKKVAMVGDRLFTDVLAGNRLGMFTILVEPISNNGLEFPNYKVRSFEVWISQILGISLNMTSYHLISNHKK